jgi:transposase
MNTAYHYIGLDIHKRTITFCAKRPDGKTLTEGTFRANRVGITQWAEAQTKPWIGGMEATLFTGFVYDVLKPYALELHVGHPLRLKAISCAKHKSDKIDAKTLANLLRADLFPSCHMAPPLMRELRRVLRYRNFLVRQAVAMKNKTTGLLMEVGVEYDSDRIHRQGYFYELLDNLDETPASVRELLRTTRCGLEMFQSAQKQLITALKRHAHLRERVRRLMTIGGVGEISALTWALEIDDPARFSDLKKAQSYCGLCSGRNESAGKNKRAPLCLFRNWGSLSALPGSVLI